MCHPQHQAKPAASSNRPGNRGRGSRARTVWAKAREGTWDLGAGAGTLRRRGRGTCTQVSWELGRPSSARRLRGDGVWVPITGDPGKWPPVGGVVVVMTGGTTQPVPSEGPLLHRCTRRRRGTLMSAENCWCVVLNCSSAFPSSSVDHRHVIRVVKWLVTTTSPVPCLLTRSSLSLTAVNATDYRERQRTVATLRR